MPVLNRAGWFLCDVSEWGVREAKDSGAVSITMKMLTRAEWDGKQWLETPESDLFSDTYVIKKDGQINQTAVNSLSEANVLNGTGFLRFADPPAPGFQIVVQAGANVYQGKTTYRVDWVYPPEHTPGSGGIINRVSRERLQELEARAGAMMRAAMPSVRADGTPF